jgi:type I restriction enzyme R subunit
MTLNRSHFSEQDIRSKFITPALIAAGWDLQLQIRESFALKAGRIVVRGKQGVRDQSTTLFADYVLFFRGIPIAIVEAKDANHSVGAGMAQAINYASLLDAPFAFSSNGDGFVFRDGTITPDSDEVLERTLPHHEFPSPTALWQKFCQFKGWGDAERTIAETPYNDGGKRRDARYYQIVAINRTVEAIAGGQNRVLLVMATGTGKTYTAFQIIWRLWKSGARKRILFLADRNVLIDQTMINDFKPFKGAMAKLSPNAKGVERVEASGQRTVEELDIAINKTTKLVDKSYEIYLSLYQAVSGTEEERNIYKQFSPDFFDLIIVDECHRGSADEDSAWREILTYFGTATQIGLTATPKETREISNTEYFGEPVYTYSLRQGIEDGYLAPYKVIRVDIDRDSFGWRPPEGMTDKHGNVIEDRVYNTSDMNRSLVLEDRDRVVAQRITEYLKATDRMAKTIVFCEDIDHANRMRQALSNANADICRDQPRYVVQITGDNVEGKRELDNFIDPEKPYPVIATTSKLMSTGVDAQTCKLIVLDQNIRSMTMFKQIIGRGTRLREDLGKTWFTILDFKRATDNFADPDFDGDPVQVYEPGGDDPIVPPDDGNPGNPGDPGDLPDPENPNDPLVSGEGQGGDGVVRKYVVDRRVTVAVARERVQYLGPDGRLITESLRDYTRINVNRRFSSLDEFLQTWTAAERKAALLNELENSGVLFDALAEEVNTEFDPFDLVLHVAYNQPTLTRRERAEQVKKRDVFGKYGSTARRVIDALLMKYADEGVRTLESIEVLRVPPFNQMGTSMELVQSFGGRGGYDAAVQLIERELYAPRALSVRT